IDEYAARLLSDMTTLVEHRALVPPDVLDVLARLRGDVVGRQTGADHRLDVAGAQGIAPRGLGRVGAASAPDGAYDSVVHGQPMLRARRIDEDECVLLIRQSAQGQLGHRGFLLARHGWVDRVTDSRSRVGPRAASRGSDDGVRPNGLRRRSRGRRARASGYPGARD